MRKAKKIITWICIIAILFLSISTFLHLFGEKAEEEQPYTVVMKLFDTEQEIARYELEGKYTWEEFFEDYDVSDKFFWELKDDGSGGKLVVAIYNDIRYLILEPSGNAVGYTDEVKPMIYQFYCETHEYKDTVLKYATRDEYGLVEYDCYNCGRYYKTSTAKIESDCALLRIFDDKGNQIAQGSRQVGKSVSLGDPVSFGYEVPAGYIFDRYLGSDGNVYSKGTTVVMNSDLDLTISILKQCDLIIMNDGQQVGRGSRVEGATLTLTSYSGWATAPEGMKFSHFAGSDGNEYRLGDTITFTDHLTLTFVWVEA